MMLQLLRYPVISLLLMGLLALLTTCVHGGDYTATDDGSGHDSNVEQDNTLSDDEDFSGKIPVTLFATTTLSCVEWKDADKRSGSQAIINKMILYVAGVCDCGFDNDYISPFTTGCDAHAGTLIVSTNISLPFNHQRSQVITYLENWIKTEPSFIKNLNGRRAIVSVVDLETTHSPYPPTVIGSGDDDDETPTNDTTDPPTSDPTDDTTDVIDGSGSHSSGDDVLGSSSRSISIDICNILVTCLATLVFSTHLMTYNS